MLNFETSSEYSAAHNTTVFYMRVLINDNYIHAKFYMSNEQIDVMKPGEVQHYVKHHLMREIFRQLEQTATFAEFNPSKPKSYHSSGSALDIAGIYGPLITEQLKKEAKWLATNPPLIAASDHADALNYLMQAYNEVKPPKPPKPPEPTYQEKATSEFEGVDPLDEALWWDNGEGTF